MSLNELLTWVGDSQTLWTVLGIVLPLSVWALGKSSSAVRGSRKYGHVASALVALGLVVMALGATALVYWSSRGRDLGALPLTALVMPFVFGFGALFAATRNVPFEVLVRYPLLRRVWAMLLFFGLVIVGVMVLGRTRLLVFTSVAGFVGLALLFWAVGGDLLREATGGDDADVGDGPPTGHG